MKVDDDRVTDSSPDCDRNDEENGSTEMAGVLLSLQSSLKQLVQTSKAQTEASNDLREDLLLQPNPNEEDKDVATDGTPNLLDLTTATNQLVDASSGHSPKSLPNNSCSDKGTNNDFQDSLTQALLPNSKTSPDNEKRIAGLVNNILTGELSHDSVKKRGEKYPPPANCKYLTPTMLNEEIWDLLSRKNRSVDLAFQRVQEPLIHRLSSLTILADQLFKCIRETLIHVLIHVMDSIALFGHANWKLNMKRREIIKPDLNPPYTRLCKE